MRRENSWMVVGDPVPGRSQGTELPWVPGISVSLQPPEPRTKTLSFTGLPLPWHKHLLFQPNPQAESTRKIRGEKFVRGDNAQRQ